MIYLTADHVDKLFVDFSRELLKNGKPRHTNGQNTVELMNVFLTLTNPKNSKLTLPARKLSEEYLNGEMDWYLHGGFKVDEIAKHSRFWEKLANNDGTVNSNYGQIALRERYNGVIQYEWCLDKLIEDLNTRQAVINYNQPEHKYDGNKDFVCTMYQGFYMNDGKLDSIVSMRSNDLIFGLSYDIVWFTYLQQKLADDLNVNLGEYNHHAISLHVYERHYDMLKKIAESNS
jgi:thymidylate synthase